MTKQLSVNFDTIYKQCKNKSKFQTSGQYDENKSFITNVSKDIIVVLQNAADIIIDYARGRITMMRNAQLFVPLRKYGYSNDIIITFMSGQLIAVPR